MFFNFIPSFRFLVLFKGFNGNFESIFTEHLSLHSYETSIVNKKATFQIKIINSLNDKK